MVYGHFDYQIAKKLGCYVVVNMQNQVRFVTSFSRSFHSNDMEKVGEIKHVLGRFNSGYQSTDPVMVMLDLTTNSSVYIPSESNDFSMFKEATNASEVDEYDYSVKEVKTDSTDLEVDTFHKVGDSFNDEFNDVVNNMLSKFTCTPDNCDDPNCLISDHCQLHNLDRICLDNPPNKICLHMLNEPYFIHCKNIFLSVITNYLKYKHTGRYESFTIFMRDLETEYCAPNNPESPILAEAVKLVVDFRCESPSQQKRVRTILPELFSAASEDNVITHGLFLSEVIKISRTKHTDTLISILKCYGKQNLACLNILSYNFGLDNVGKVLDDLSRSGIHEYLKFRESDYNCLMKLDNKECIKSFEAVNKYFNIALEDYMKENISHLFELMKKMDIPVENMINGLTNLMLKTIINIDSTPHSKVASGVDDKGKINDESKGKSEDHANDDEDNIKVEVKNDDKVKDELNSDGENELNVTNYSPNGVECEKLFITTTGVVIRNGSTSISIIRNDSTSISIIGYDPDSNGYVNRIPGEIMAKHRNIKESVFYKNIIRCGGINITDFF